MIDWLATLSTRLASGAALVRVVVVAVRGSVPREPGACMLIGADSEDGTIGGGHLELKAIGIARDMLANAAATRLDRFVLGATLGQCCGGAVELWFERWDAGDRDFVGRARDASKRGAVLMVTSLAGTSGRTLFVERDLQPETLPSPQPSPADAGEGAASWTIASGATEFGQSPLPHQRERVRVRANSAGTAAPCPSPSILAPFFQPYAPRAGRLPDTPLFAERLDPDVFPLWLFGNGHVGRALVKVMADLPVRITWVDSRDAMFPAVVPDNVTVLASDDPAGEVRHAPPGTLFLVMTHSHDLDYDLCHAILEHDDYVYAGLIGSDTKATRFARRLLLQGVDAGRVARLKSPIGVSGISSKLPAAIAIAVAAELLQQAERAALLAHASPPHETLAQPDASLPLPCQVRS